MIDALMNNVGGVKAASSSGEFDVSKDGIVNFCCTR